MKTSVKIIIFVLISCLSSTLGAQIESQAEITPKQSLQIVDPLDRHIAKMRELEQSPLTDHDRQFIRVGEDTYVRDRGETDFKPLKEIMPAGIELPEVNRELNSRTDRNRRDFDRGPETSKSLSSPANATDVLIDDGFENGFPGDTWYTWDDNGWGVEAYWGNVGCRPYSGDSSIWCSVGGGILCSEYAFNIRPSMTLAYTLDITDYQDITLTFRIWYQAALDPDSLLGDDDHMSLFYYMYPWGWEWVHDFSGSSGGWQYKSYNFITDGATDFDVLFEFDEYFWVTDEDGIFIDEVRITGTVAQKPNLTYGQPPGWSGPITVSHTENATSDDLILFSDQPAFINFGVTNNGDAIAENFYVDVYVDDTWVESQHYWTLDPGETDMSFRNVEYTFTPGTHTVRIEIDTDDYIVESDETDNSYSKPYEITGGGPDLQFYTPPGWSGPVVVTNDPESRIHDDELAADRDVYLHFAVINAGNAPILVEFENWVWAGLLPSFSIPWAGGLMPGEVLLVEAYPFSMPPGLWDLHVQTDAAFDVFESDETNNDAWVTCNAIEQTLTVKGRFEYQIPANVWGGVRWLWGKNLKVELLEFDVISGQCTSVLDVTYADADGVFEFDPIPNKEDDGTPLDIVLNLRPITEHTSVKYRDSPGAEPLWISLPKGPWVDVPDAVLDFGVEEGLPLQIEPPAACQVLYVACVLEDNWRTWSSIRPEDDIGTVNAVLGYPWVDQYDPDADEILISTGEPTGDMSPSTIQRLIISRLFSERMQERLWLFAWSASPRLFDLPYYSTKQAAWAGFADFWAAYERMANDAWAVEPFYAEISNSWADTVRYQLETGEYRISLIDEYGTVNCLGPNYGPTAACILWDLYDDENDDESSPWDWGNPFYPHYGDGIGDAISMDMEDLLYIALDKNSHLLLYKPATSILELFAKWWQMPSYPYENLVRDVLYEHGTDIFACRQPGDMDFTDIPPMEPDLMDITYMINFFYKGGTPPPVVNDADINQSCHLNLLDITYLIAYMYKGGPAPQCGCLTELPIWRGAGENEVIADETAELLVAYGSGTSVFQLSSSIPLEGVEIQFSCDDTAPMQSLCAGVDLHGKEIQADRTIALMDATGEHMIEAGFHDIAEVDGETILENAYGANSSNELVEMSFQQYLCGDANQDGVVNILDVSFILAYLNSGGPEPAVLSAADPNGDCSVDTLDASYLIAFLYQSGPEPLPGCIPSGGGFPPLSSLGWDETDIAREPVTVHSKYERGITFVELSSGIDLLAIELEVICSEQATAGLNQAQCYTVRDNDRTRVALVDAAGSACVVANQTLVIEVAGEAEVVTAVAADMRGRSVQVGLNSPGIVMPAKYVLYGNYPNPFNPATTIKFDLSKGGRATIVIYNILGQEVRQLTDQYLEAGHHEVLWDGTDRNGNSVATGTYLYKLMTDGFTETRKMLLVK